jgi:hypothetical protein
VCDPSGLEPETRPTADAGFNAAGGGSRNRLHLACTGGRNRCRTCVPAERRSVASLTLARLEPLVPGDHLGLRPNQKRRKGPEGVIRTFANEM